MRKNLLAALVCALVLCVSGVNADEYDYNGLTGTLETENWSITDFYGTGNADGGVNDSIWDVEKVPTPKIEYTQVKVNGEWYDTKPDVSDRFGFVNNGKTGLYSIVSEFTFTLDNVLASLEETIVFTFKNLSSAGMLSFILNEGTDYETSLAWDYDKPYKDEDGDMVTPNTGSFKLNLADLLVGENTLTFQLDNKKEGLGNNGNGSTYVGFEITGATGENTTTPEPATLAVIGLGTLGAGFAARRRIAKK